MIRRLVFAHDVVSDSKIRSSKSYTKNGDVIFELSDSAATLISNMDCYAYPQTFQDRNEYILISATIG